MSQQHRLEVIFKNDEGAVLRLLGLLQRRGFALDGIDMLPSDNKEKTITLMVKAMSPTHRVETLLLQIKRLHEVKEAKVLPPRAQRGVIARFQRGLFSQDRTTCF
jgi:acetolactate synthase II small subunit